MAVKKAGEKSLQKGGTSRKVSIPGKEQAMLHAPETEKGSGLLNTRAEYRRWVKDQFCLRDIDRHVGILGKYDWLQFSGFS